MLQYDINEVSLTGVLTEDPIFTEMPNGTPKLTGRIRVRRQYKGRDNKWKESTSTFAFNTWQDTALHFQGRLFQDSHVFLTGRIESIHNNGCEIQVRKLKIIDPSEDLEEE